MIENVSTQLTVFNCFAHCLLPGRAFASLYALLFLEKEAEIGGREYGISYEALYRVYLGLDVRKAVFVLSYRVYLESCHFDSTKLDMIM